jgi:hypothetical protein
LTKKERKKSSPDSYRGGPTHRDSAKLKVVYLIAVEGRRFLVVLCGATGGADFSLTVFIVVNGLQQAKKRRRKYSLKKVIK